MTHIILHCSLQNCVIVEGRTILMSVPANGRPLHLLHSTLRVENLIFECRSVHVEKWSPGRTLNGTVSVDLLMWNAVT